MSLDSSVTEFRGYPVRVRHFTIRGREYELLGPANYEQLVDDPRVVQRFARDEFLPYWAEFWPACLLLADAVAAWGAVARPLLPQGSQSAPQGPPNTSHLSPQRLPDAPPMPTAAPCVLELGCGLGLVSLVATSLGYAVIASDYDDDALAFVEASARRNCIPCPTLRFIDWRERYPELRFDRIVAAEITYETRSLRPIAEFVHSHLKPDGFALICDANRGTADAFEGIARACGLHVEIRPAERPGLLPDQPAIRGRFFYLTHKAPHLDA